MRSVWITGASGVIGRAMARQIAALPDHQLVLVGRKADALKSAQQEVLAAVPHAQVRSEVADLSRRSEIYALSLSCHEPIHVLINNASATPRKRELTADGLEVQFATNVLGYVWMMDAFAPHLEGAEGARIVNVASYYAGGLDVEDLQFSRRPYDNNAAYRQSKQAERMLSVSYAERLRARKIAVNSCHPGDTRSKLASDLGFGGSMTADACARTPVWLATSEAGVRDSGAYFANERRVECEFARDKTQLLRLEQAIEPFL
jgi:NAD(P)-dependent dehydrogenase (short-subunit alcohol dehydrogenase family)